MILCNIVLRVATHTVWYWKLCSLDSQKQFSTNLSTLEKWHCNHYWCSTFDVIYKKSPHSVQFAYCMYCVGPCYMSLVIQLYVTNQECSIPHQKERCKNRLPTPKPYVKFLIGEPHWLLTLRHTQTAVSQSEPPMSLLLVLAFCQ
jgi:hypothetical protein